MNINKEIEYLKQGVSSKTVFEAMQVEREDLDKKIYFFKVITLINGIKEMIESNDFFNNNVGAIGITHNIQDDTGDNYFSYNLYNMNGKKINQYQNDFEPITKLNTLFKGSYGFSLKNMSEEMLEATKYVDLKIGAEERISDLLLSKELKQVYDNSIKPLLVLNHNQNITKLKF